MHHFSYNEDERRKIQNPEKILEEIGLRSGMTFIDIGCNDGFFTIPAAKIVGQQGMVYGIDVDAQALDRLTEKAKQEKLTNIVVQKGAGEETVVCLQCADIIFLGTVLHDFMDPSLVLSHAKEMLKNDGRIVNIDWKKEHGKIGPPFEKRFSEKTAVKLLEDAGLVIHAIESSSPLFYQIQAGKKK